ncbi:MAG TPA: hypothetical protein VNZ03_36900 [Terriglobales bacterium]|nr:hypothetical protein [Terriglobales bacterium]
MVPQALVAVGAGAAVVADELTVQLREKTFKSADRFVECLTFDIFGGWYVARDP